MREPCGWGATPCATCCTDALELLEPEVRTALEKAAVRILWAATGKRYGLCEKVLRPCRRNCGSYWGGLPSPMRISGNWVNVPCGSCRGSCGCDTLSEFTAEDVHSVVGVTVDGEELDPFDVVRVYDNRRLVRVDGDAWPACQNLNHDTDEAGTWSVTILQGEAVPDGGELMAGILLCELAKACAGDDGCRLPRRVQNITRQGVSVNFADVFTSLGELHTGLFEVDLWSESVRSTMGATATISSIDVPRPAVLTWPLPDDYPSA